MLSLSLLALAIALPFVKSQETVLGVYIFSRHGDRTSKSTPPTNLTDLGYNEVFTSGSWFRDHYISSSASSKINGINPDLVKWSQIAASAPLDTVLMPSAMGFLQGLYPPVGSTLGSQKLRNGSTVQTPLNGFQVIPVSTVTTGTASEDSAWLQGASNCQNAIVSSNRYYDSPEFKSLQNSTMDFYRSIAPTVNATFAANMTTFKNAYAVYDLLNVASIHNASIPSSDLLTNSTLLQLRTLADTHEFSLAYNASDPSRAIAGATLAAQVVQALNATIAAAAPSSKTKAPLLNIQFGAYGSFQSFFGLAGLVGLGDDWVGVPDYASTMTFELFTNATVNASSSDGSFPAAEDLNVRFLFHNGTTSNSSAPTPFPLFGQGSLSVGWTAFVDGMGNFSVGSQEEWCAACGNTTGVCGPSGGGTAPAPASGSSSKGGNGLSPAVNGVIGAFVALAVVLGVEALVVLAAGLRVVRKGRGKGQDGHVVGNGVKA